MNELQNQILGALVGLARSTSGNEDLVTPLTLQVILDALVDLPTQEILNQIEEEKRKLVPNCFYCANPCGRTSNYDMNHFENTNNELKDLKQLIITNLRKIAQQKISNNTFEADELLYNTIFTSLFYIGEDDCEKEDLIQVITEQNLLMIQHNF